MVMPRSRSMSIRSRYCARALRSSTTPVSWSIRSASVDLPWSMWAMMQKLRIVPGSVRPGCGAGTVRVMPSEILPRVRRCSDSAATRRHAGATYASRTGAGWFGPGRSRRKDVPVQPSPIPHGRTARRLEWAHLPPPVRAAIEQQCGASVVSATSRNGGFTPGFASVLECDDGVRHFVKAASMKAQRLFADAYREEARKLAALPLAAPAPRLLWTLEVEDWFVLSTEYVDARAPHRPWRADELRLSLDML